MPQFFSTLVGATCSTPKRSRSAMMRNGQGPRRYVVTPERCTSPIPIRQVDRDRKAKQRFAVEESTKGSPSVSVFATVSANAPLEATSVGSLSPVPFFPSYMRDVPMNDVDYYQDYPAYEDYPRQHSMSSLHGNEDTVSPLTLPMSCEDENPGYPENYQPPLSRSLSSSASLSVDSQNSGKSRKCCFLKENASLMSDVSQENESRSNLYFALRQFEETKSKDGLAPVEAFAF